MQGIFFLPFFFFFKPEQLKEQFFQKLYFWKLYIISMQVIFIGKRTS